MAEESDYRVALEGAWVVRDVGSVDDAVSVAVSEAGRRLSDAGIDYVEVDVGGTVCPACGEPFESTFVAADTALVGLVFELKVFSAGSDEHAAMIAKSTVGKTLPEVSLELLEVEAV